VHTLAASYVSHSAAQATSAATAASERKSAKYSSLLSSHIFCPVAIETLGPLADEAQHFLTEIGRRATRCTADPREAAFRYQRISVAIQRFNAVCLANSLTSPSPHRNHSGHSHYTLLIYKSLRNEAVMLGLGLGLRPENVALALKVMALALALGSWPWPWP